MDVFVNVQCNQTGSCPESCFTAEPGRTQHSFRASYDANVPAFVLIIRIGSCREEFGKP